MRPIAMPVAGQPIAIADAYQHDCCFTLAFGRTYMQVAKQLLHVLLECTCLRW